MIEGVKIIPVRSYDDERGLFVEMFRKDSLLSDIASRMQMATYSWTKAGMSRGPHEHLRQTDNFFFIGPSDFKLYLWDNRKTSPTYKKKMVEKVGRSRMVAVIVPPGVVHGYKNIGDKEGLSINFPDRLYKGVDKKEASDEIRHEKDEGPSFIMD